MAEDDKEREHCLKIARITRKMVRHDDIDALADVLQRQRTDAREHAVRDIAQRVRHWLTEMNLAHEIEECVGDALLENIHNLMNGDGR